RLAARAERGGIVGLNIGANKITEDRGADYVRLIEAFAPVVSYFTVNISSPNTPGLRDLQQAAALDDLLVRVVAARDRVSLRAGDTPVLVKIAPDLTLAELDDVVAVARRRMIDGMIVCNTTVTRPPTLRDAKTAQEAGGLSGKPLYGLATRMLAETFVRAEGQFPLVGVGGIDSGATALAKIRAGANLLQVYSALVFRGLGLVGEIKDELLNAIDRGEARALADLVGLDAADITAQPWPQ
ncbi:MAG TPA: dihydroorotate dehydrogenase (quinone), partial [Xanthobacteraceae bacterium]